MEEKELDFVTKDDLLKLQQDLKMEIQKVTHREIEKNNETLMVKIEEKLLSPMFNQIQRIGSLVTFQDVNKKWVSKSVKSYLGIRIIGESKYEYDSIISAYKAKLRVVTNKSITRLEDIPQTIENIKLLDSVCRFMYPKELNRGNLFKTRVNN